MAGIYVRYKKGVGAELAGFIDIAGHVDVFRLISLSLSVYYGLRGLSDGQCFGEANITIKIEMFLFDVEVHLHTEKRFAGGASNGAMAIAIAPRNCMRQLPSRRLYSLKRIPVHLPRHTAMKRRRRSGDWIGMHSLMRSRRLKLMPDCINNRLGVTCHAQSWKRTTREYPLVPWPTAETDNAHTCCLITQAARRNLLEPF
jgi:hypothetical protein